MPTYVLEMEEEYSSEGVMDDDTAIKLFEQMCKLMGARLIPFRDEYKSEMTSADGAGKRKWKIKGCVKFIK